LNIIFVSFFEGEGDKGDLKEAKLCPNCARQGQIFPNGSKRNQKLVEKVELNQLLVIEPFFNF
jgi:hypothetical protein